MTDNTNIEALPELPEKRALPVLASGIPGYAKGYTTDQMRDYGLLCHSAALSNAEPEGEVGAMTGTEGFTMVCFHAKDVPIGTKLFLHPSIPAPKATTVLVYRDKGRSGVGGQTIGANGAGEFAVVYYGMDEAEADIHARATVRGLEAGGHKITEAFIVSGEGYHGPVITHVGLPLPNTGEQG